MESKKKPSLLLIDGECGLALTVVRCLAIGRDVRIHVLSSHPRCSVRYSRYVASFHSHDATSEEAFATTVSQAAQAIKADLLLACSTSGTEFLIRLGPKLNIPLMHLPELSSFQTAVDKWALHNAAKACNVASPPTWLLAENPWANITFPVLVKPRYGEGGIGIVQMNTARECTHLHPEDDFILQEYVDGQDIGCSVFCHAGRILAFTIQQPLHTTPNFTSPRALQFAHHQGVLDQVRHLVQHLQWTGVANFDMRIRHSDGLIFLLDLNPRFWASIHGSQIAGTNFVRLNCSQPEPSPGCAIETEYYRGEQAFSAWLRGHPSDFPSRLRDPLPDLGRIASLLKAALSGKVGMEFSNQRVRLGQ